MENQKRHEQPTRSARKSLKRKLEEDFGADRKIATLSPRQTHQDLIREIRTQVEILDSTFSSIEADRAAAKRAVHVISELAKNGNTKPRLFNFNRNISFLIYCKIILICVHAVLSFGNS